MSISEKSMTERSTVHSTFVIERTYAASPERVFAAWSAQAAQGAVVRARREARRVVHAGLP